MAFRFQRKVNPIGIEFRDSGLRIAKVTKTKNGWNFPIMQDIDLPEDTIVNGKINDFETLVWEIQTKIPSKRLNPQKVVIGLPGKHVILRHIKMPNIPKKAMRNALMVEFQTNIHLPFENPVFDFVIQNHENSLQANDVDNEEVSVVVVAAPGEIVDSYVAVMKAANLVPIAVDITLTSIERFAQLYFWDELQTHTTFLLMHVSEDSINMGVFSQGVLYFSRTINLSIKNYLTNETFGETYNYRAFASDLVFEVERGLNFYQYTLNEFGNSCNLVFFISEIPGSNEILEILQERLDPMVVGFEEKLSHLYKMPSDELNHLAVMTSKYAVAIGLSMKEVIKSYGY